MHRLSESESDVAQPGPTLCDPVDCSQPCSSIHGIFPGKNTGVGCHFLLQGIFPTQGLSPGCPHCKQMLYRLSHQRSPCIDLKVSCLMRWPTCPPVLQHTLSRLSPSPSTGPSHLLAVHPPLLLPLTPLLRIHCTDFYHCEYKCCRL